MDLANWALRTLPKFTTGVFDQIGDPDIPITLRPLLYSVFLIDFASSTLRLLYTNILQDGHLLETVIHWCNGSTFFFLICSEQSSLITPGSIDTTLIDYVAFIKM